MVTFIRNVIEDIQSKGLNFEDVHFILPSKRAGTFLKHQLSDFLKQPIFSPSIQSIEEFIEDLSGLKQISNSELLFKLYSTYKEITPDSEQESFESFSKWAQILIQDFNEIDRFLIPHKQIFDYLKAIKELNHWSLDTHQTDLIKNHLKFWRRLKSYYEAFTDDLLRNKQGYQGLIYREASENLEVFVETNTHKTYVFLGFNALNEAESRIIQGLLQNELAVIYWDIDEIFVNDTIHDAGLFMRGHKNQWNYYNQNSFKWVSSHYQNSKDINVIGIPKNVGQAKYIGQLLQNIGKTNSNYSNVAIVLGEENLLFPVLNSIPRSVEKLNVTMGMPLKHVPLASFFELLFKLHKDNPKKYYYKDVTALLTHPSVYILFSTEDGNEANKIIDHIQKKNLVYITTPQLMGLSSSTAEVIKLLFESWDNNCHFALKQSINLIFNLKKVLDINKLDNQLDLEYLYRFNTLFNQLIDLSKTYNHLDSIRALHIVYKELLNTESLDFKGEPLEGLQIMGMLESRVLDFETVIISSVNEGILPSGKTNNSFIPFDVKLQNNLPTYKEKDAVYTYHFYRLLQRAKNVYLLYNTEVDTLKGGEKSRFITQLEIEGIHKINHHIVTPSVPLIDQYLEHISKTQPVLEAIKSVAKKGFSPSSLSNYIRNPIDFYYEKILGVKEFEDVEENIAANTLGSVIHKTLEDLYKPFLNEFLSVKGLESVKKHVSKTVTLHFNELYNNDGYSKGKNLIIFEIAKRYIQNFIDSEIESLNSGNKIKILALEAEETVDINIDGLDFEVKLKGTVDRIDQFNECTRIIDYKSGKVEANKVEIVNWEDITSDYDKYSKSFQVLCYAYMLYKKGTIVLPVEAGIISFKNLNEGFLKFGKKDSPRSKSKNQLITEETLLNFETQLKKLILEICNPQIDFIEKELENAYN